MPHYPDGISQGEYSRERKKRWPLLSTDYRDIFPDPTARQEKRQYGESTEAAMALADDYNTAWDTAYQEVEDLRNEEEKQHYKEATGEAFPERHDELARKAMRAAEKAAK